MAESSMSIDNNKITTFTNQTANSPTDLDNTITEIVDKFNAMLETATGHSHDGTDSRSISSSVSGLTMEEFAVAQIMGWLV
jgi:hypothetical protein